MLAGRNTTTLNYGLPRWLVERPQRGVGHYVEPPADDFWHNGRLNMGPAILLIVTLSLVGWGSIIGAGYLILRLI